MCNQSPATMVSTSLPSPSRIHWFKMNLNGELRCSDFASSPIHHPHSTSRFALCSSQVHPEFIQNPAIFTRTSQQPLPDPNPAFTTEAWRLKDGFSMVGLSSELLQLRVVTLWEDVPTVKKSGDNMSPEKWGKDLNHQ